MASRSSFLTIYSSDRSEVYGEFADGRWDTEDTQAGPNHVFSGTAGDGTIDTFHRLDAEGISHVEFDFDHEGRRLGGPAQLLALNGHSKVRIETGEALI